MNRNSDSNPPLAALERASAEILLKEAAPLSVMGWFCGFLRPDRTAKETAPLRQAQVGALQRRGSRISPLPALSPLPRAKTLAIFDCRVSILDRPTVKLKPLERRRLKDGERRD